MQDLPAIQLQHTKGCFGVHVSEIDHHIYRCLCAAAVCASGFKDDGKGSCVVLLAGEDGARRHSACCHSVSA